MPSHLKIFLGLLLTFLIIGPIQSMAESGSEIKILWYSGGVTHNKNYKESIKKLIEQAGKRPTPNVWEITFWDSGPIPEGTFDVLVVASSIGKWSSKPSYQSLMPNIRVSNLGSRIMVTGQDADLHYLEGRNGKNFNGPLGFLIDAINWAGSGKGMGAVYLSPDTDETFKPTSILKGLGKRNASRGDDVTIPESYATFPINEGLTSEGLSWWNASYHESWEGFDEKKWAPINISTQNEAITLVSASEVEGFTNVRQVLKSEVGREIFLSIEPEKPQLIQSEETFVTIHLTDSARRKVKAAEPIEISLESTQGELSSSNITIEKGKNSATVKLLAGNQPALMTLSASSKRSSVRTTIALKGPLNEITTSKEVVFEMIIDQSSGALGVPLRVNMVRRDQSGVPIPAEQPYLLNFYLSPLGDQESEFSVNVSSQLFGGVGFAQDATSAIKVDNGGTIEWKKSLGSLRVQGEMKPGEVIFTFVVDVLDAIVLKVVPEVKDHLGNILGVKATKKLAVRAQPGTPTLLQILPDPDRLPADGEKYSDLTIVLLGPLQDQKDSIEHVPTCPKEVSEEIEFNLKATLGAKLEKTRDTLITHNCNTRNETPIKLISSTTVGDCEVTALSTGLQSWPQTIIFELPRPTAFQLIFSAVGGILGWLVRRYKKINSTLVSRQTFAKLIDPSLGVGLILGIFFYLAIYYGAQQIDISFYRHAIFAGFLGMAAGYVGLPIMDKVVNKLGLATEKRDE